MTILYLIACILIIVAFVCFFKLTPEQITNDLMQMLTPRDSMHTMAKNLRGNQKKHKLYRFLKELQTAMISMSKQKQFTTVITASLVLIVVGIAVAVLMQNWFLIPVTAALFAMIPFFYVQHLIDQYEEHTRDELETALSIISTSYIRSDNIVEAVRENVTIIKPPIRYAFQKFLGEATAIQASTKKALYNLREEIDSNIFKEWVDTLIQCQDDRGMKDTLIVVVNKLTDLRLVNNELQTMLASARMEYWVMLGLLVLNIPLLWVLNKDWYAALMHTTPGKITLAICAVTVLITAIIMRRLTRPIDYK